MQLKEVLKKATKFPWWTKPDNPSPNEVFAKFSHCDQAVVVRTYSWEGHGDHYEGPPGGLKKMRLEQMRANAALVEHMSKYFITLVTAVEAANHALKSYRYGNDSRTLAEEVSNSLDVVITDVSEVEGLE